MIKKVSIIAKNTFVETIRQPVYAVILAFALFLFVLSPSIAMYTLDEDIKLLREIGLSTLFLTGLFIAIFSASGAVAEEIDSKTITTVLSKPVRRPSFIIGKFLGVLSAVGLAHYIGTIAMFLSIRHGVLETASDTHDWTVITVAASVAVLALLLSAFFNYSYDWSFTSTAILLTALFSTIGMAFLFFIDRHWEFNPSHNGFTLFDLNASVLLFLAVMILIALAVMFSTRFNIVLTLIFCIVIFLVGLINGWAFGRFVDQHWWAQIGRMVFPDLQAFWISDAIYEDSSVPANYLGMTALYATLYTSGILAFAIALFQKRQVG
ncbi:ABC-type transport system involved in multi-copper enzyme maturation, permease component [Anaerohalosphaera lusitana]|uniref:ABC-type transport system involved in multi-copper enzyme maturation, permease component n=1 Tax=Anaerohalosphaera lusitana TaxID=1936003 RepID=A0A1U9NLN8_9BACT|nr:ABC transporter permease subunit [Anaerohalosphaera lusitana]AQT68851.1 ABC-type transport system involved in multi-copper enzyme maturation, permease component [Anaerohalosphaera lusitana]